MIVGLGIDLCLVSRVARLLARHPHRFRERCFTAAERAYCDRRADPAPHYAARFAAKEATLKALGIGYSGGVRWTDVEIARPGTAAAGGEARVRPDPVPRARARAWARAADGAPAIVLCGAARRRARAIGAGRWRVAITHERDLAAVVVIAEGNDRPRRRKRPSP